MRKFFPLILIIMFGCGSGESDSVAKPSDHPADSSVLTTDTVGQQSISQPPVSADSAGARKKQERSSIDTVQRP